MTESVKIIQAAIVHSLLKEQHSSKVVLNLRDELVNVKPALQRLVGAVHDAYAKRAGKSYGAFEKDAELYPAQTHIRQIAEHGGAVFVEASKSLMRILAKEAGDESLATGGYVLMADLLTGGTRWLLVAVLTDVAGAAIDDDLDVVDSTHLDLSVMRFAGRVNLTDWEAGSERYISFLRGKKSSVSEYFQKFIGCSTVIKPLQETQRLVAVIKKFCADQALDDERKEKLLADVDTFGRLCIKDNRLLELDVLANQVWPDDPDLLRTALADSDPPISDGFIPDARSLLPLKKFKAKTKTWALEFERSAMADHTIRFDAEKRELKITDIPADIAEKLRDEFSND